MRVIVTRPEREALRWCAQLSARGFNAVPLPLISIGPVTGQRARRALESTWQDLQTYFAVMFVSTNAVTYFFSSEPSFVEIPWSLSAASSGASSHLLPRCWAPGPGTAQALQQAGVPAHAIDAPAADSSQFDSEALWQRIRGGLPAGARVLIVRGSEGDSGGAGRDWLAQQLAGAGVQVETVAAYERGVPLFSTTQMELARQAAQDDSVWLFSSSRAIRHLMLWMPAQDWRRARAMATHPRIAEVARQAGFAVVWESRPTLDEVAASIESVP